jgi:hypothetical protein
MDLRPIATAVLLVTSLSAAPCFAEERECSGTLSGSAKGKFTCLVSMTTNESGQVFFVITPKTMIDGIPSYAPGAFQIPAPPRAQTYTLGELLPGRASVAVEGGTLYTATKTSGQRGEVALAIKSLKPDPTVKGAYRVRGTYRAKLLPVGEGRQGEVVVEAEF